MVESPDWQYRGSLRVRPRKQSGRQHPVLLLRCYQDHGIAGRFDFDHLLHPELLSAGTHQKDSWPISRHRRKLHRSPFGYSDAVLLLLVHSAVHWLHQCGSAAGCHILFPDFFPNGGFRKSGASDEHFWMEGRHRLCGTGPCDCGCWRNAN